MGEHFNVFYMFRATTTCMEKIKSMSNGTPITPKTRWDYVFLLQYTVCHLQQKRTTRWNWPRCPRFMKSSSFLHLDSSNLAEKSSAWMAWWEQVDFNCPQLGLSAERLQTWWMLSRDCALLRSNSCSARYMHTRDNVTVVADHILPSTANQNVSTPLLQSTPTVAPRNSAKSKNHIRKVTQ